MLGNSAISYVVDVLWSTPTVFLVIAAALAEGPTVMRLFGREQWADKADKFLARPKPLFLVVILAAFVWANFSAYHNMRIEKEELKTQLSDREGREQKAKILGNLLRDGRILYANGAQIDDVGPEYAAWIKAGGEWYERARNIIRSKLSDHEAEIFIDISTYRDPSVFAGRSMEYNSYMRGIAARNYNLKRLLEQYQ